MTEEAIASCQQCGRTLQEGEPRHETDEGAFCPNCYQQLRAQVESAVADQGRDINYFAAGVGGLVGAVVGAVAWWGFTIVTEIAFGLVAIVIGVAVGKGVVLASGGKRGVGLQIMSVGLSAVSFFYASFLVNRTFLNRALEAQEDALTLPLLPSLETMIDVIGLDFGIMDVVFLAIVLWQAWAIPKPMTLAHDE